jgi:hypothetical protein
MAKKAKAVKEDKSLKGLVIALLNGLEGEPETEHPKLRVAIHELEDALGIVSYSTSPSGNSERYRNDR